MTAVDTSFAAGDIRTQAQRLKDNETLSQHLETLAQYIDTVLKTEGTATAP